MSRLLSLMLALSIFVFVCACTPESTPATEPAPSTETATKAPADPASEPVAFTKDGKLWCPLMNKEVKSVEDAKGSVDHEGVRYYFCCDMCAKNGSADPAKVKAAADKL